MSARNCGTCAYWFEDLSPNSNKSNEEGAGCGPFVGTCQYFPPVTALHSNRELVCIFPLTHGTRWCGRWLEIDGDDEPDGPDDGERVVVEMRRAA